jgi:hypothetical protein
MMGIARNVLWIALFVSACGVPGQISKLPVEQPIKDHPIPLSDGLRIVSLGLAGVTSDACRVDVANQVDADGQADLNWNVHFTLDGQADADSLPVDPGESTSFELRAVARPTGEGPERYLRIRLSLLDVNLDNTTE